MPLCIETKVEMSTPCSMPLPFMFGPDRGAFLREFMSALAFDVERACDETVLPDADSLRWWTSTSFRHDYDKESKEHVFTSRMVVYVSSSMWTLITSSPSAEADFFFKVFRRFEERLQEFATQEFDLAKAGGLLEGVFASA